MTYWACHPGANWYLGSIDVKSTEVYESRNHLSTCRKWMEDPYDVGHKSFICTPTSRLSSLNNPRKSWDLRVDITCYLLVGWHHCPVVKCLHFLKKKLLSVTQLMILASRVFYFLVFDNAISPGSCEFKIFINWIFQKQTFLHIF